MADYTDRRLDGRRRSTSQPRDYFFHVGGGGPPPKQERDRSRPQAVSCGRSGRRNSVCQPSVPSAEEARRRSVSTNRRGVSVERATKTCDPYDDEYDGHATTGRGAGGKRRAAGSRTSAAPATAPSGGDKASSRRSTKQQHQDLETNNETSTVFKFDLGDGSKHGACKWKPKIADFNRKVFCGAVGVIAKAQGERAAKALWDSAPPCNNDELRDLLTQAVLSVRISEGVHITKVASEYAAKKGSCAPSGEGGRCRDKTEAADGQDGGRRRERGRDPTRRHDGGGYPSDYPFGKGYGASTRSSCNNRDIGYGI